MCHAETGFEVIALQLIAMVVAQEFDLLLGFDAFGDHLQAEVVAQRDDGPTMVASSASVAMSCTKERSTFSRSTGKRFR